MDKGYDYVVLRRWKDTKELIALFPYQPVSMDGYDCNSYMHIGQHSGANYVSIIRRTIAVNKYEEAAQDLLDELKRIGYNTIIIKRVNYNEVNKQRDNFLRKINDH